MFGAFERMHERWRKRMQNRKGQSLVEFALVFPFFLLAIYGILYFGFVFADYITLNDIARSTARTASLSTEADDTIKARQLEKTGRLPSEALGTPVFHFVENGTLASGSTYEINRSNHNVTVKIGAPVNSKALIANLFLTFYNFRWGRSDSANALPFKDGLTVTYTMYDESGS